MLGVVVAVSFVGEPSPAPDRSGFAEVSPRQSVWQGVDDPSDFLVLLGFADERSAGEDLRQLVESEESPAEHVNLPSEVHHIAIEHAHGTVLDDVPSGGFLATVRTVAAPGYGRKAGERLEETLTTLAQVEGYCGHLQGHNEAVDEEAWAFVFVTTPSRFPAPQNPEVAVRLYRRRS